MERTCWDGAEMRSDEPDDAEGLLRRRLSRGSRLGVGKVPLTVVKVTALEGCQGLLQVTALLLLSPC